MIGYKEALEAAGAAVLAYESFGSYQGDWLALVEYEGKRGWVHGYYGSCSGCDAFEGEFGYEDPEPEKLAAFGREYLTDMKPNEKMLADAATHSCYSLEDEEMLKWVRSTIEKTQ